MSEKPFLPELPEPWEQTTATLHAYALGVGAIPRAHGTPHPKWWHISLKVRPNGLVTDNIALPGGGIFNLQMDLRNHVVVLESSAGEPRQFSMTEGLTGTEFADQLIKAVADHGLEGEYAREKFENTDPRHYDPETATTFLETLVNVDQVFHTHRAQLPGEVSPVQVWPHGFDLSFDWFGTRTETYEEDGEVVEYPSQLNLGFYPFGRAYFYSNPWPFEQDQLLDKALPSGAEWFTEGWEGTILYYDQLQGDPKAADKLLEYAQAVYEIASPTLTA